ncbi:hypothetical protein V9L05_15770 [Bernardetia sp. Wsw4-3y2]|uniref:hypothetical protein n=1 Tax=Bernardetia sp. Wsw4-3y2 TaxID=3127471 RepID=UPI0030D0E088
MTEFQSDKNTKIEKLKTEKIAILSVLKPVDDVRAYQKIAKLISHNSENSKKTTLIGFEAANDFDQKNTDSNINFIELFTSKKNKNRLGLWRFFAGFRVFNQLLKLKPNTIIVCAVELTPFTLFFKFLFNSKSSKIKLVYDLQENYVFNILYQDNYPHFLKKSIAFLIRSFEKFSSSFVDLYLLAERCYLEEISFLRKTNYIFLENKFLKENLIDANFINSDYFKTKEIKFLIYGSFSKTYGTLEGILFFKKLEKELQRQGFSATLILAGYCSDTIYSQKIIEIIKNQSSILLINTSIDKPVSHEILLQQLQKSDFVILPYLFNKSTQNCIPTKFYECLAYKKPMLISKNQKWKNFIKPLEAGIFIDFEDNKLKIEKEIKNSIEKILSQSFYTKSIDEEIWKFDEKILRKVI